jgi:hypothetical protein
MTRTIRSPRWRVAIVGLTAALALMLVLGTPQGRGTAADFLTMFRGDRAEGASLSTDGIANLNDTLTDLERLGTVSGLDATPEPRDVTSIAEASQFVGFDVLQPDAETLPEGVNRTPTSIRVVPAHELRFTFERETASAYYASIGRDNVDLPDRFDGASLVITTAPAAILEYRRTTETGEDAAGVFGIGLLIGQAGVIAASTEGGVTLDELQEFLIELPGLSLDTKQQLGEIDDWRTALPIPLPTEQITWERATIAGSSGLLLNDNTGLGSAALWQRDGRIFAIAGTVKAREIQDVADTLH